MKQSSVPKKQFACSPPRVEEQRGNMGRETDFLHEYLFYLKNVMLNNNNNNKYKILLMKILIINIMMIKMK